MHLVAQPPARHPGLDAAAEQHWNEAALAQPVWAPAWRLWAYREPAVVLGCSQRRWLAVDGGAGDPDVIVRSAGGGAVLVGPWMLGLSAVLPAAHPLVAGGPVPSYRWLGEAIAESLRRIGVDATALPPLELLALRERRGDRAHTQCAPHVDLAHAAAGTPPQALPDWACFGGLSPWEVLARERKIAGLAQVRRRHGVLLVAGVLTRPPPWSLLCDRLGRLRDEAQRLALASTSCAQERADADPALVAEALRQALAEALLAALGASHEPEAGASNCRS